MKIEQNPMSEKKKKRGRGKKSEENPSSLVDNR